jgi:hypothetical protein
MKKIIFQKIKAFFKKNYLYISIGFILFWMYIRTSFRKNEKAQETIDKSKEQIYSSVEEINNSNISIKKAEIEYEIKNNEIKENHDAIRQEVEQIVSDVNLTKFEQNRKLNELHNQIKKHK